ncbi:FAD-dependent oxidoreductase [Massilia glaciei]|uniref:FAD-dependent oxidoreductase n=1 Tax=Massilia glaciei TaxID=1524097 RepID=A0A2U2HFV2_9BURK|nr:FAD-dependent oxidoreductase [Massilia glaciei]PWF43400.1 FAD-dependent oxidoreductase [Massilia glaciei]
MNILILGAGPAGLMAAKAALGNGANVTLVEENHGVGGQIWRGESKLIDHPKLAFIGGARVVSRKGERSLLLETAGGGRTLAWERLIVCAGARELLLPFPGWTLPGVTGAGGLQALVKGGMPVAGRRVVVAGSGPLLLAVAASVQAAGAKVAAIVEHRGTRELARFAGALALRHGAKLGQAATLAWRLRGVPYLRGATLVGATGDTRLRSVTLRRGTGDVSIDCDFLAAGFGLVPNTELGALLGCAIDGGRRIVVDGNQRTSVDDVWAAGECTGIGGVDKSMAEGRIAGLCASGAAPGATETGARSRAHDFGELLARSFAPTNALRAMCQPTTIVCRCEDVTAARLTQHADWRNAKLQTRAGMGPCQGRVCGSACEFLYGWQAPAAQCPIFPASAATLAGAAPYADISANGSSMLSAGSVNHFGPDSVM